MIQRTALWQQRAFGGAGRLLLVVGLLLGTGLLTGPAVVQAQSGQGIGQAVAGAYFIVPEAGGLTRRVVTLTEDGNAYDVVHQSVSGSWSDGMGAWEKTAQNEITARVIQFDYDEDNMFERSGVFRVTYILRFANKENGKFQTVEEGTVSIEAFSLDQNPLDPTEDPIDTVSFSVLGQRINVE